MRKAGAVMLPAFCCQRRAVVEHKDTPVRYDQTIFLSWTISGMFMKLWSRLLILMGLCCMCVMPLMAQDAEAGYQEALRRIEEARMNGVTRLDLSKLGLETL